MRGACCLLLHSNKQKSEQTFVGIAKINSQLGAMMHVSVQTLNDSKDWLYGQTYHQGLMVCAGNTMKRPTCAWVGVLQGPEG